MKWSLGPSAHNAMEEEEYAVDCVKNVRLRYQRDLELFEISNQDGPMPIRPEGALTPCVNCNGSGLIPAVSPPEPDTANYPKIAIIGGGIGGVALAVACLHRGIPYTLYERDASFDDRSQGYGLTLQQASKAMIGFGISNLKDGVISTRHVVHTTDGKIIGEWGMRKRMLSEGKKSPKRTNVHIARQALRLALLEQLEDHVAVKWGHQLIDFEKTNSKGILLNFKVNGQPKSAEADLVVGADGIRSTLRRMLIGDKFTPLRYLDCIVILGICPLEYLDGLENSLLDLATVFQTANGNERIYMMPYSSDTIMWQLSFPMKEAAAISLSAKGKEALKEEACRRTKWHDPIPQILAATPVEKISGYPVYDRDLLTAEMLEKEDQITLIGDAAHPMSPFKGQGANQALLDALSLARGIAKGCKHSSNWKEVGLRERVLKEFETEMLQRSANKVNDSAEAALFLHSDDVLHEGNEPRSRQSKKNEDDEAV